MSLTPHGISEIILWHIEYSLSALLAGYAIYTAWFYDGKNYKKLTIVAVFLFISLGINPSTVLALIFIIFVVVLYKRKVSCGDLFVVTSAVSSFVFGNAYQECMAAQITITFRLILFLLDCI